MTEYLVTVTRPDGSTNRYVLPAPSDVVASATGSHYGTVTNVTVF